MQHVGFWVKYSYATWRVKIFKGGHIIIIIIIIREFQPMASTSDDSSLLSDQDTDQFLV